MNVRALVAEAVGTFILVGMGSLSIVSAAISQFPPLLIAPFGFGLGLLAAIAIGGHISGAHFNPAVTLSALLDGRIGVLDSVAYLVVQVAGAVAASLMILLLTSKDGVSATRNVPGMPELSAFGLEIVLTAVFVAVILTVTRHMATQAILVIPLTLAAIHFAAIPISGASVNPARSLGPAIIAGDYTSLWIYVTAPFIGAVVGWGLYRFLNGPLEDVSVEVDQPVDEIDDFNELDDEAMPA